MNIFGIPFHNNQRRVVPQQVPDGWIYVIQNYQRLNHIAATLGAVVLGAASHVVTHGTGSNLITSHFRSSKKRAADTPAGNTRAQKSLRGEDGIPIRDKARGFGNNMPDKKESAGSSRGAHNDGGEVPVSNVPRILAKTVPDHFTINLPYSDQWLLDATPASPATHASGKIIYRTNNVVAPLHQAPGSSGAHEPMGYSKYVPLFNYYRVLKSSWKFTIINTLDKTQVCALYWNDNVAEGIAKVTEALQSKYSTTKLLPSPITSNTPSIATMHYEYTPGSMQQHIRNIDEEERWTPMGSAPALQHYLQLQAYNWKDSVESTFALQVIVEALFTVQFKEALPEIYWTTNEDLN